MSEEETPDLVVKEKKEPTRKSVSIRTEVFKRLEAYCVETKCTKSEVLTEILEEFFLEARRDLIRECARRVYARRKREEEEEKEEDSSKVLRLVYSHDD